VLVAHACNPNSWKGWDQEDLVWEETPSPTITNKETKKKKMRERQRRESLTPLLLPSFFSFLYIYWGITYNQQISIHTIYV
jgi:hypothetical protein